MLLCAWVCKQPCMWQVRKCLEISGKGGLNNFLDFLSSYFTWVGMISWVCTVNLFVLLKMSCCPFHKGLGGHSRIKLSLFKCVILATLKFILTWAAQFHSELLCQWKSSPATPYLPHQGVQLGDAENWRGFELDFLGLWRHRHNLSCWWRSPSAPGAPQMFRAQLQHPTRCWSPRLRPCVLNKYHIKCSGCAEAVLGHCLLWSGKGNPCARSLPGATGQLRPRGKQPRGWGGQQLHPTELSFTHTARK